MASSDPSSADRHKNKIDQALAGDLRRRSCVELIKHSLLVGHWPLLQQQRPQNEVVIENYTREKLCSAVPHTLSD